MNLRKTLRDSTDLLKWFAAIITVFILMSLLLQLKATRKVGTENNVYLRTVSCILSVPLAERTDEYISGCYLQAEINNGVQVDHFGNK